MVAPQRRTLSRFAPRFRASRRPRLAAPRRGRAAMAKGRRRRLDAIQPTIFTWLTIDNQRVIRDLAVEGCPVILKAEDSPSSTGPVSRMTVLILRSIERRKGMHARHAMMAAGLTGLVYVMQPSTAH